VEKRGILQALEHKRRLERELDNVDNTLNLAGNQMHSTMIGADSLANANAMATELEERKSALDRAAELASTRDPIIMRRVTERRLELNMSAAKAKERISRIQHMAEESRQDLDVTMISVAGTPKVSTAIKKHERKVIFPDIQSPLTSEEADPPSRPSTVVGFSSAVSSRVPTPDGATASGPFGDQEERLREDIHWLQTLMLAFETKAPNAAIRDTLYCYNWTKERVDNAIKGYVEQRAAFISERDRVIGEKTGGRPKRDTSWPPDEDTDQCQISETGDVVFPSLALGFRSLGKNWFGQQSGGQQQQSSSNQQGGGSQQQRSSGSQQ